MNSENKKINKLYDDYKYFLYKNISQYSMIAIINRLKKCEKIREEISLNLNSFYNIEFEKRTFWDKVKILRLLKAYRNTKVKWDLLEKNLKQYYGYRINNEFYIDFLIKAKKIDNNFNFNDFDCNLISESELVEQINTCLKYLKKNFNRLAQVIKYKRDYNKMYYEATKLYRGIRTRTEVNKELGEKKSLNSKLTVLNYIGILKNKSIKITIKNILEEFQKDGVKLGQTQVSIYLKELKQVGLV